MLIVLSFAINSPLYSFLRTDKELRHLRELSFPVKAAPLNPDLICGKSGLSMTDPTTGTLLQKQLGESVEECIKRIKAQQEMEKFPG